MADDEERGGNSSSSSSSSSSASSSGSSSSSSDDGREEEEEHHSNSSSHSHSHSSGSSSGEEENGELFGEDDEEYTRVAAQSPFPPPTLPPPARAMGNSNYRGNGGPGGWRPNRPMGSGFQGGRRGFTQRDERLVAEMKLIPNDETLCHSCPAFQVPCEIGCYSRSVDGDIYFDARSLRSLCRSVVEEVGADLNNGFETFVPRREDTESSEFGDILAALRNIKIPLENIHFVTPRNNLNKILSTAYNKFETWEMGIHKRVGTVYLDRHKLAETPNERQQRVLYWGYSFKHLATEQEEESAVDANVKYCALIKTKLGAHRIIMGAEMDSYDGVRDGKRYYMELKTCREVDSRTVVKFEREKLLKFWIQSFLAGVPKIICGFRDDDGVVTRVDVLRTQEVAHRAKQKNLWQGNVCLAFADRVLCWLYGTVKENEDYLLRYISGSNRLELLRADTCPMVVTQHLENL